MIPACDLTVGVCQIDPPLPPTGTTVPPEAGLVLAIGIVLAAIARRVRA